MEFIVLDLETTGLSKSRHKITEIAAVKVKDNKIVDEFQTLVNPKTPIPRFITRLTGIDDEMVKHAPTIDKIMPHLLEFLGNTPIVAHNASFDYGFLSHNTSLHTNNTLDNHKICTKRLANRLLPDLPSKKLSHLCDHYEITNEQAHRAMSDVLATNKVLCKFLTVLNEKGFSKLDDILHFQELPLSRCHSMIYS